MSSTKRGGRRSPFDKYSTPLWVVNRLLDYWPKLIEELGPVGDIWLEPCAGEGNIIFAALNRGFAAKWHAVELREECRETLQRIIPPEKIACPMRFQDYARSYCSKPREWWYSVSISNPPFSEAQEVIESALKVTDGLVITLLRLNYAGAKKRHAFFQENPPARILVVPNRISFDGRGQDSIEYAFFVWNTRTLAESRPTVLEWLDLSSLDERKRLVGSWDTLMDEGLLAVP